LVTNNTGSIADPTVVKRLSESSSVTQTTIDVLHPYLSSKEAPFSATFTRAPKFEIIFTRVFDVNLAYASSVSE
jgi:hypothetical protein